MIFLRGRAEMGRVEVEAAVVFEYAVGLDRPGGTRSEEAAEGGGMSEEGVALARGSGRRAEGRTEGGGISEDAGADGGPIEDDLGGGFAPELFSSLCAASFESDSSGIATLRASGTDVAVAFGVEASSSSLSILNIGVSVFATAVREGTLLCRIDCSSLFSRRRVTSPRFVPPALSPSAIASFTPLAVTGAGRVDHRRREL